MLFIASFSLSLSLTAIFSLFAVGFCPHARTYWASIESISLTRLCFFSTLFVPRNLPLRDGVTCVFFYFFIPANQPNPTLFFIFLILCAHTRAHNKHLVGNKNRCGPCEEAGPGLSDLADEFEGRVAVVGINNESIFGETEKANVERLVDFLEAHRDGFRYTIYVDTDDGFAKECKSHFALLWKRELLTSIEGHKRKQEKKNKVA